MRRTGELCALLCIKLEINIQLWPKLLIALVWEAPMYLCARSSGNNINLSSSHATQLNSSARPSTLRLTSMYHMSYALWTAGGRLTCGKTMAPACLGLDSPFTEAALILNNLMRYMKSNVRPHIYNTHTHSQSHINVCVCVSKHFCSATWPSWCWSCATLMRF